VRMLVGPGPPLKRVHSETPSVLSTGDDGGEREVRISQCVHTFSLKKASFTKMYIKTLSGLTNIYILSFHF